MLLCFVWMFVCMMCVLCFVWLCTQGTLVIVKVEVRCSDPKGRPQSALSPVRERRLGGYWVAGPGPVPSLPSFLHKPVPRSGVMVRKGPLSSLWLYLKNLCVRLFFWNFFVFDFVLEKFRVRLFLGNFWVCWLCLCWCWESFETFPMARGHGSCASILVIAYGHG